MDKKTLQSASSDVLAARVVVYRSLGVGKDLAIQCMAELDRRRAAGDSFNYEDYIEIEVAKIPKIDLADIGRTSQSVFQGFNLIQGFLNTKNEK